MLAPPKSPLTSLAPAMSERQPPSAAEFGRVVRVTTPEGERDVDIYTREGFEVLSRLWTRSNWENRLSYEVSWLGIPIIQLPEDMVVMQELLWKVRPDVIVESGVAHGGALVLYASILELLGRGRVIGVDIEIRKYNRLAIEAHPLSHRIHLIEGDSLADETVEAVRSMIRPGERVMVALDSAHSRDHVLGEL
jgi:cephalosporin hydroxylase